MNLSFVTIKIKCTKIDNVIVSMSEFAEFLTKRQFDDLVLMEKYKNIFHGVHLMKSKI